MHTYGRVVLGWAHAPMCKMPEPVDERCTMYNTDIVVHKGKLVMSGGKCEEKKHVKYGKLE